MEKEKKEWPDKKTVESNIAEVSEKIEEIKLQEEQIKGEEIELKTSSNDIEQEKEFIRIKKKSLEPEHSILKEDKNDQSPIQKKSNDAFGEKVKQKVLTFIKNKYNFLFMIVLFLAFFIRLKYIGQESLWNDAAEHLWYAIKVTQEPLFGFSKTYLYGDYALIQTLTAPLYLITKDAFLAGKIVAIFFGLIGIIFMYLLGKELKNGFIGLISAALLGFHHLLWFYGVRLLADGPLVSMVVVCLYLIVKLEKEKKLIWGFLTVISFIALLLVKKQGVLLFVAFLIYLLIFKRKEAIKAKAILVAWLLPIILIIFASLFLKVNLISKLFGRMFSGGGFQSGAFNALKHFVWIFSWYLLVPMLIGLVFVLIYRKREYYFSLVFFLIYWIYFEVGVITPEDRYLLPLLPVGIIFTAFALTEIGSYFELFIGRKKLGDAVGKLFVLLFIIFICWHFYGLGNSLISSKSSSYAGHPEAGQWFRENVPQDTPIFVGSPRMQRAFIGREYAGPGDWAKGGSLWYLRADKYLNNKSAFEKDLATLSQKSEVYLEIDVWEYTQPKWYFPITQNSLNYFNGLGFKLIKVIEKEILTQKGKQKRAVIFIFKKEVTVKK